MFVFSRWSGVFSTRERLKMTHLECASAVACACVRGQATSKRLKENPQRIFRVSGGVLYTKEAENCKGNAFGIVFAILRFVFLNFVITSRILFSIFVPV